LRPDSQNSRRGDFVPPGADINPFAADEDVIEYANPSHHQGASPWTPSSAQHGQTSHYGGNDLIDFHDQYGNPSTNLPTAQSAYMPSQPTLKHSDTFMTDGGKYLPIVFTRPTFGLDCDQCTLTSSHYAKPHLAHLFHRLNGVAMTEVLSGKNNNHHFERNDMF
jgi:hypothetical protein